MAEKIYKIQKELEEKRAIRKQKAVEAGQPQQPNMPGQMQGPPRPMNPSKYNIISRKVSPQFRILKCRALLFLLILA